MAKECSNSSCSKESCEGCPSKAGQGKPDFHIDLNADSSIKHVIGVVSGKGGVGKSMVTASLANQKAKEGYKVGILDADITGPSIPKMYGLKGPANVDDKGVYPAVAANGVKVMSINLLLPGEEEPVIWRGPVIAGTVKQFWTDVIWGDLDYLFVDMPPGTGDVPLTVFQSLPVDGIIVMTSPQELVSMIVEKAVKMAQLMNVPVIGIVENLSYYVCPDCGAKHKIFGDGHVEEVAAKYDIKAIAEIPINHKIAAACDKGMIELFDGDWLDQMVEVCLAADNPHKHDGMPQTPENCTNDCGSCGVEGCGSRS